MSSEFYVYDSPKEQLTEEEIKRRYKAGESWTQPVSPTQYIYGLETDKGKLEPEGVTITVNNGEYTYLPHGTDEHGQAKLFTYDPPKLNMLHGTPDVQEETVQRAMALAWRNAVKATGHLTHSTSLSPFSVRAVKYATDRGLVVPPHKTTDVDQLYNDIYIKRKERALTEVEDLYRTEYRESTDWDDYYDDPECHAEWENCDTCDPRDEDDYSTGEGVCSDCEDCAVGSTSSSDFETYSQDEEEEYIRKNMEGLTPEKAAAKVFRKYREQQGYGPGYNALEHKKKFDAAQKRVAVTQNIPGVNKDRLSPPSTVPAGYPGETITKVSSEEAEQVARDALKYGIEFKRNKEREIRSVADLQAEANTEYDNRNQVSDDLKDWYRSQPEYIPSKQDTGSAADDTDLFGGALDPRTRLTSTSQLPDAPSESSGWKLKDNWDREIFATQQHENPFVNVERVAIPYRTPLARFNDSNPQYVPVGIERVSDHPGLAAALNARYEDTRNTYESLYGEQNDTPRPQAESRSSAFSTGTAESNEDSANRSFFNK